MKLNSEIKDTPPQTQTHALLQGRLGALDERIRDNVQQMSYLDALIQRDFGQPADIELPAASEALAEQVRRLSRMLEDAMTREAMREREHNMLAASLRTSMLKAKQEVRHLRANLAQNEAECVLLRAHVRKHCNDEIMADIEAEVAAVGEVALAIEENEEIEIEAYSAQGTEKQGQEEEDEGGEEGAMMDNSAIAGMANASFNGSGTSYLEILSAIADHSDAIFSTASTGGIGMGANMSTTSSSIVENLSTDAIRAQTPLAGSREHTPRSAVNSRLLMFPETTMGSHGSSSTPDSPGGDEFLASVLGAAGLAQTGGVRCGKASPLAFRPSAHLAVTSTPRAPVASRGRAALPVSSVRKVPIRRRASQPPPKLGA